MAMGMPRHHCAEEKRSRYRQTVWIDGIGAQDHISRQDLVK